MSINTKATKATKKQQIPFPENSGYRNRRELYKSIRVIGLWLKLLIFIIIIYFKRKIRLKGYKRKPLSLAAEKKIFFFFFKLSIERNRGIIAENKIT